MHVNIVDESGRWNPLNIKVHVHICEIKVPEEIGCEETLNDSKRLPLSEGQQHFLQEVYDWGFTSRTAKEIDGIMLWDPFEVIGHIGL